jgi:hypothetical protein
LILLLGLHLLLRRFWVALAIWAALPLLMNPVTESAGYNIIGFLCAVIPVAVFVVALRFGFLGNLTLWFTFMLWMNFPVTTTASSPHFATGAMAVLLIAGLAARAAMLAGGFQGPYLRRIRTFR